MNINRQNYHAFSIARESNYFNEKTPLPLTAKVISIIFIILLVVTGNANAARTGVFSLENDIIDAELIVRGKLVNTFSRSENIPRTMQDGNHEILEHIPSSIFTTYIFNVEEVLKGKYEKENIKILMLGGCDDELGMCVEYSFNYYYEVGEQAVIFLTKSNNNYYKANEGAKSAYSIKNNNILIRKSSGEYNYEEEYSNKLSVSNDKKIIRKNKLTIEGLKTKISDWKNNNEK